MWYTWLSMARVLDLKNRNNRNDGTSVSVPMETLKSHLDRDVLLTAVVVMPACLAWIVTEKVWLALILAVAMYLAFDHGLPAVRRGSINFDSIIRLYENVREMVRSRIERRT